jgi:hypothetical protein
LKTSAAAFRFVLKRLAFFDGSESIGAKFLTKSGE